MSTHRVTTAQHEQEAEPDQYRVLLVGSSGGHLAQLLALEPWWRNHRRHWVTFDTADAQSLLAAESVTWAYHPTTRNMRNLMRNGRLAAAVLHSFRPDVVVSTGAGVALPFFLLARSFGARTIYVEVYDRLDTRTLTARLCRPFTDVFCAQWDEQRNLYPDAELIGGLL